MRVLKDLCICPHGIKNQKKKDKKFDLEYAEQKSQFKKCAALQRAEKRVLPISYKGAHYLIIIILPLFCTVSNTARNFYLERVRLYYM